MRKLLQRAALAITLSAMTAGTVVALAMPASAATTIQHSAGSKPWSEKNANSMDCHIGVSGGHITSNRAGGDNWIRVKITHDNCSPGSLWIRIVAVCQRHATGQAWNNTGKAEDRDGKTIGANCAGTYSSMREYNVQWKVLVREGTRHHAHIWRSHALYKAR